MRSIAAAGMALAVLLAVPAAAKAPYPPPSDGQGSANPSRVKQGNCTTFSGDGFAASTLITMTDDDRAAGTTSADKKGRFSAPVCFARDARVGQHVLRGWGRSGSTAADAPAEHRVSAVVTVTGVEQSGGNGNGNGNGKREASSFDAQPAAGVRELALTPFGVAVLGLLLMPLVSGVLLVLDSRHRRRRTS